MVVVGSGFAVVVVVRVGSDLMRWWWAVGVARDFFFLIYTEGIFKVILMCCNLKIEHVMYGVS